MAKQIYATLVEAESYTLSKPFTQFTRGQAVAIPEEIKARLEPLTSELFDATKKKTRTLPMFSFESKEIPEVNAALDAAAAAAVAESLAGNDDETGAPARPPRQSA